MSNANEDLRNRARRKLATIASANASATATWDDVQRLRSRNAALDALGEALDAAEKHLFDLNLGVEGRVLLKAAPSFSLGSTPQGTSLAWGKMDGIWCLYVEGDGAGAARRLPVLKASAEWRKLAARGLSELLATLRTKNTAEIQEIAEATEIALAFARGEHDNA